MIKVKNISSAMIVLTIPKLRFRRELVPGREVPVTQEEYETMMFDPGINTMVQDHYIRFSGVEDENKVIEDNEEKFVPSVIREMLENQDITKFAQFIPNAAPAEKDTVVKLAIELGITNSGFVALIKKYCDVDIINAINVKHLTEEN